MITKEDLRKQAFAKRDTLNPQEIEAKSEQIKETLFQLEEFKQAKVICSYISVRSEVSTVGIIKESLSKLNKRIVVPITLYDHNALLLSELKDFDQELERVRFGLLEPKPQYQRLVDLQEVDLILVPGVAFDERGYRLGYGGGYYDWLLNQLKSKSSPLTPLSAPYSPFPTIGLAFEKEIVPQLPVESWDMAVSKIITEQRIIVSVQ